MNTKTAFLFAILISVGTNAKAQTKDDTQNWLTYNLNKYFSNEPGYIKRADKVRNDIAIYGKKNLMYSETQIIWTSLKFSFNNEFLKIEHYYNKQDSTGEITSKYDYSELINLKLIKNIELIIDSVNQDQILKPDYQKRVKLNFVFKETDINSQKAFQKSVVKSNESDNAIYYNNFLIELGDLSNDNSDIEHRIIKALKHLSKLNGGDPIKDVF